jgi:protein-tyrosine kinase
MERIQQAIEKARAQRQGKIGQTPEMNEEEEAVNQPAHNSAAFNTLKHSKSTASSDKFEHQEGYTSLAYTQTRVESPDAQSLVENRVIAGFDFDHRVESYRQLRTQMLKMMRDNCWNTLAITSAHERAGKTLTAVNLAISISREVNHTVLLVDLDLRDPSVHCTLDFEVTTGLVDYLQGGFELEEVLVNPGFQRLIVLPSRRLEEYSSEIISSPEMKRLITDIRNRYENRIIIFDLPPLLRNDEALQFTPTVDATLLVVEDGVTTEENIQRSLQLLEGSNLVGTILNKARD